MRIARAGRDTARVAALNRAHTGTFLENTALTLKALSEVAKHSAGPAWGMRGRIR